MTAHVNEAIERKQAVRAAIAEIQAVLAEDGLSRASLERVAHRLEALAARTELFPLSDFPAPTSRAVSDSTHYLLHKEADDSFALYLNSINPGKVTPPHNHSTWAAIVAIDGEEINEIYTPQDAVTEPGPVRLLRTDRVTVRPGGAHVTFLGDDIHSIHVVGDRPTRHLHLYGRALETLSERLSFDLETGAVRRYESHRAKDERDARN